MTGPDKDMVKYEIRRQQLKRRRRMVATFAGVVVLAAALVLMVPALSMTADKATNDAGFFPQPGAQQGQLIAGGLDSTPTNTFTGELAGADGSTVIVTAKVPEGALPEGARMLVAPVTNEQVIDVAKEAASAESSIGTDSSRVLAADITFVDADGNVVEPGQGVLVTFSAPEVSQIFDDASLAVVHVDDDLNAETLASAGVALDASAEEVAFEASSFSVYAVVYTVDFHWEVDGKSFECGIPGGGATTLGQVIETLGIRNVAGADGGASEGSAEGANGTDGNDNSGDAASSDASSDAGEAADDANGEDDTNDQGSSAQAAPPSAQGDVQVGEQTKKLLAEVAKVEFSSPELVWVGKVDSDTTVGKLKKDNNLKVEYSVELTKQEIAQIDAQTAGAGDWALVSLKPFETEESLTVTMKNGEQFTIRVTDAQLRKTVITSDGNAYQVTVTYDGSAKIPEGSTLRVTEITQDTEEYSRARNAVLADKKARDEKVDLSTFNLAALDISIIDPQGAEIEPSAEVQVDIQIKELPGVEDLSTIADTLQVQHHVEAKDGVVVETVFDSATEGTFQMKTDSEVAKEGTAVDPASVSDEDFAKPEASAPATDASQASDEASDGAVDVSFQTPVFSTFTVTWNGTSTVSNNVSYLWATAAGVNTYQFNDDGTYSGQATLQTNNLHFMNSGQLGIPGYIFRTPATEAATGDLYLVYNRTGSGAGDQNVSEADSTFHIYFNYNNATYADVTVHYVDNEGNPIQRTKTSDVTYVGGSVDTRYVDGTGSNRTLSNYAGTKNGYTFAGVSEVKPSNQGPHTTVHYGYMDGNNFVEFESQPSPTSINTYHHAYLIYDFDGYKYAGNTYYRTSEATNGANVATGATSIQARLRYNNNRWQYRSNNWNNVADGSHIYVVYEKKTDATQGGTPTIKQSAQSTPPEDPTITKGSTVNGDGTNTLALSVTGHTADLEVEKLADVIVVFDISGSMSTSDMSRETRLKAGRDAINSLAHVLLNKTNSYGDKLIRMGLVTFSTDAQVVQGLTDNESVFAAAVNKQTNANGGTNWEKALMLANQMEVDSGRATFVIFVTDGDPTFRISRKNTTDSSLDLYGKDNGDDYYVSNNVFGEGNDDTQNNNYNAAKVEAESIISHKKTLYTIAISPDATHLNAFADDVHAAGKYTATSTAQLTRAFDDIAASIIALMGHSDVKITDGITALTQTVQKSSLVSFAEDDFTYYKGRVVVATQADVNAGRASKVGDPIPATQADVDAGLAETIGGTKVESWQPWDPASEGCAKAVYDSTTGAVEWDMGESFMLQDGYTYQVRFKVWPSQEAYDLLADLNNGKKSYASLSDAEKAQIKEPATEGGMYTLKTNSDTKYTYQPATKSGDTVTLTGEPSEGSFADVDPLELTTRPLKVKKRWYTNYVDSRDIEDEITLDLYGADDANRIFREFTLSKTNDWYDASNFVSYGLMTLDKDNPTETLKIYETGHDFTLRETGENAHYYELTAAYHRPMVINGTPTILERIDAAPGGMANDAVYYKDGDNEYYRLDGKVYRDTETDVLLIATNGHRSYMDLTKAVVDENGTEVTDGSEFEYKITFTVPEGAYRFDEMEKWIWFSVYDPVAKRTLAPSEYTYTVASHPGEIDADYNVPAYANYLVVESGQEFTLKIKPGWNVRFLNLMNSTQYKFEETNIPDGYSFKGAAVSGTRWEATFNQDGTEQGSAVELAGLPANDGTTPGNTTIAGTIDWANARYTTTYTNKTQTKHVNILKTDQDSATPLAGAVFDLYAKSGYEANPQAAALKTGLPSDAEGKIDLGKLSVGTYYLVETTAPDGYNLLDAPVEITVTGSGVTHSQPGNSSSQGQQSGDTYNRDTDIYTLTVTNSAGYELPSTGGIGTTIFTVVGIALVAVAIVLLVRRRK